MIKRSVALLCAALWLVHPPATHAQRQPLLIATIESLDGLFADLNYLAEAAGAGQLGQILTMTTQQYAQGLDSSRAITVYVDAASGATNESRFRWLVFLPTQDLPTFLGAASSQLGTPRPLQDGIIQTSGARTLYLRQQGAWTLVADSVPALQAPTMPLEQIVRATDTNSDISIRGFVANLPEDLRATALRQIQSRANSELAVVENSSPAAELRRIFAREKWDQVAQLLRDADEFSLSLNTDSEQRQVTASVNLTARPNTLTYRRLDQFQTRPSAHAGMLAASAIGTWNAIGQLPREDTVRFEPLLGAVQTAVMRKLGSSSRFTDDATRQLAMQLAQALWETCRQSLQTGFFDGAGMIFLAGNQLSAVTGMHVADTSSLKHAIEALARRQSAAELTWQAQMNVASHEHVNIHRFLLHTPNDPTLRRAVGPQMEITIGIAPQDVYLAWGSGGVALIENTIDAVQRGSAAPVLPFHSRVSVIPLLRFYQQASGDPTIGRLLQTVGAATEGDAAIVRATPIRDGVRFDIKLDESVLRAAGYCALLARQRPEKTAANTSNGDPPNRTQARGRSSR